MSKVKTLANYLRFGASSKILVVSAAVVVSGFLLINNVIGNPMAASAGLPRDNDSNAIMYGGAVTKEEFIEKYNANKTKDLPQIYEKFGLSADELNRFKSTAKMGVVYKNGDVKVDGKMVAHGALSVGRENIAGSSVLSIAGKAFYIRPTSVSFNSDSIAAYVLFTDDQKVESIILTACGNPVTAFQPSYQCDMLNKTQLSRDSYQFNSNVTAKDGAKLTKVVYDFGDGSSATKTNPSDKVNHTYKKAGKYTAKVTAYFDVYGETKTSTKTECTKPIEVKEVVKNPSYACDSLELKKITRTKYEFIASTSSKDGATLANVDFNFGDDQSAKGVKSTNGKTVNTSHDYSEAGDYTIVATANFNIAGGVKADTCEVSVTVDAAPEVPVTPVSPETPAQLPSTGIAGLVGGTLGLGSVVTAGGYYFRSRGLLNNVFKK